MTTIYGDRFSISFELGDIERIYGSIQLCILSSYGFGSSSTSFVLSSTEWFWASELLRFRDIVGERKGKEIAESRLLFGMSSIDDLFSINLTEHSRCFELSVTSNLFGGGDECNINCKTKIGVDEFNKLAGFFCESCLAFEFDK
jgi:hypothetical protein